MHPSILLITPPFTQLNTPYPATAYLKGFLQQEGYSVKQLDLSLATSLSIFSRQGLSQLFDQVDASMLSASSLRLYELREEYIATIDTVISFLQGRNQSLAQRIAEDQFLPKGDHFLIEADLEWAFGQMGFRDKARHYCTLYLEDLARFITDNVDPYFGFSRYAEQLGRYAGSFEGLYEQLFLKPTFIDQFMFDVLKSNLDTLKPDVVGLTIPFPGNLYSALRCGQFIKLYDPTIKIVMGGGFVNTELRRLSDARIFDFTDFILLDDGELPFLRLLTHLFDHRPQAQLVRTFVRQNNAVQYINDPHAQEIRFAQTGTPDYADLPHQQYLSVIEVLNPMHKLWSDGFWNKMTLAHGCYWGKCAFCDGTLDYIKRYDPATAVQIVDKMEQMIIQTGETGFHFVDEAAPPKLLKAVSLEILRRKLQVTWWTNIRFERNFTADLCRLMAASGCIAVSGGLEIASDRLLKLINKGVTVDQVARVTHHFTEAQIMVHAYLMYGFPTQTTQETIDSLENVRQLFAHGCIQSAFWHRFAMTAHSPIGKDPKSYGVAELPSEFQGFADNDRLFHDPTPTDHDRLGEGLRKSLYNYLHGVGLDFHLSDWFSIRVPNTTVSPQRIAQAILETVDPLCDEQKLLWWVGGKLQTDLELPANKGKQPHRVEFVIQNKADEIAFSLPYKQAKAFISCFEKMQLSVHTPYRLADFKQEMFQGDDTAFRKFFQSEAMSDLCETALFLL